MNADGSPAAGAIPERPLPAARGWIAVTVGLLALVLFLRKPDSLLNPQFWAEDSTVFFKQAYDQGFLRAFLMPYSGYLHALPRLGAGLALLFPLKAAPLVCNLVAFIVQMLPVAYLLGERMGRWIPDRRLRVVVALLYVVVPNSYETYANLCNSQWNLALVGLLLLTVGPPRGRWGKTGDLLLLVLFSLTGPFAVILLPCALMNLARERRGARRAWFSTQATIVAAGATCQAALILASGRTSSLTGSWPTLPEMLRILSTHVFFNSLLGMNGSVRYATYLTPPVQVAGLALTAALACLVLVRRQPPPLLWLLYLAGTNICCWFLLGTNHVIDWQWPEFGPRYFTHASLFVLYATVVLCAQGGRLRPLGALLALPVLAVAIPGDFAHPGDFTDPRRPNTHYADQIAVFESLPLGASFSIPVQPDGWSGFVLRKKTAATRALPLDGLRLIDGEPDYFLNRPSIITLDNGGKQTYVNFSGWAADSSAKEISGGVWLEIDGKLFPAVTGRENRLAELLLRDQRYRSSGFSRDVPLSELGVGSHRISLVVLTHDRQGYRRTPSRFFNAQSQNSPAPAP